MAEYGQENIFRGSEDDAINALEAKLAESVRMQMVSDRPLGAFLSGGIDSSLLVALMRESAPSALKTFTIGFAEPEFDESPRARAVAKHLGTEHHELIVTMAEARDVITLLPTIYDEPFADVSQIPTYLLARMAREHRRA